MPFDSERPKAVPLHFQEESARTLARTTPSPKRTAKIRNPREKGVKMAGRKIEGMREGK